MGERDVFEARLRGALSRYVADGPTDFDAREFARAVATAEPRQRGRAGSIAAALAGRSGGGRPWRTILVPPAGRSPAFRIAWIAAVAGLLLAAVLSAAFVGGELLRRSNEPAVVPPALVDLTTKAKPLPSRATCPPGSDPDVPGPPDQERLFTGDGAIAFDRHAGRIIALADDDQARPRTWTFDVCTNTWQRMNPPEEPAWDDPVTLVYDADSDRTVAFARERVWSYESSVDRWTMAGRLPKPVGFIAGWGSGDRAAAAYHDPSGLVIVYDGQSMWAYDVDTDSWTVVRQLPDPSRPVGSGLPGGVTTVVYDRDDNLLLAASAAPVHLRESFLASRPFVGEARTWLADALLEIWAFDPGTRAWRLMPSKVPAGVLWQADGFFYGPVSRAAFDESSGVTTFMSSDGWVEAYDDQRSRPALPANGSLGDGSDVGCDSVGPAYDPLHDRIVCLVREGGVSAFSTATGDWRWLLEPEPSAMP